jgi:hypothetical protein
MLTPSAAAGSQYYKIGDWVTFVWDYTSLSGTPTAVNVMATCTQNSQLYTIAMKNAVPTQANATQTVLWDTAAYESGSEGAAAPLVVATYTLIIYDSDTSISATADPGYMAAYSATYFGMYSPQPYTPLSSYNCATCSAAFGNIDLRAVGFMLAMVTITLTSFTWFIGGTGVIW